MPVSICEPVSAAIRDNLSTTNTKTDDNFTNTLSGSAKQLLLTKIEYEETNIYKSSQDSLQSKYIFIKSKCNSSGVNNSNNSFIIKSQLIEKEIKPNLSNSENNGHSSQQKGIPSPKRILYPRENVQLGWHSTDRKWKVGCGMINVGNTCYLNSALQAIFHVPAFANWLQSDVQHREKCQNKDACIVCGMAETLIESQRSDSAIKPYRIYSRLRLICRHLVPGRQEDSHEFLRYLVDAMEKSYLARFKNSKDLDQISKETTPLNQILGGYLRSAVRCLSCDYISTTFQHFEDMILDIKKANTIEEALEFYFARERLEDMGYNCESCKRKVSATKQFFLERPPAVLCVQLKRFIIGSKLNKHVNIRTTLDLTPYLSPTVKKSHTKPLKYKLVSMITHLGGSQHNGHYTAIGWTAVNGYYQFDDSCVRQISVNNVLNTNAYVMFYELETSSNSNNCTSTAISNENNSYGNSTITSSHASTSSSPKLNSNSTSTSVNIIRTNNNSSKLNGFIGPMLPPQMQKQQLSVEKENETQSANANKINSSISKVLTISGNKTPMIDKSKLFYNGNNAESKLVQPNANLTNNRNLNTFNGLKRPASMISSPVKDTESNINSQVPEKRPHLSSLPSMPKLFEETSPSPKTIVTPTLSVFNGTLDLNKNSYKHVKNNQQTTKSLVPSYDSNDDSDSDDVGINDVGMDDDDEVDGTKYKTNKILKTADESSESSCSSVPDSPNKSSESIEITKAGPWKVSDLNKSPCPSLKGKTMGFTTKNINNNNFNFNNNNNNNNNNNYHSTYNNSNNRIKKFSDNHHKNGEFNHNNNNHGKNSINNIIKSGGIYGYGQNVKSWNGEKSQIEKEVAEEKREEKKRQKDDEFENDMDRGKMKKFKKLNRFNGRDNPGFNPFEETQLQQNRKWVHNGARFYNPTVYRQHHNKHRNNNNRRQHNNNNNKHRNNNYNHRRDNKFNR